MSNILLERTVTRAVLTLNRPEKLNALSFQMKEELIEKLEELAQDDQLRVVILTGSGDRAFCAGTDIGELSDLNEFDAIAVSESGQRLCDRIEDFPVPVIACINGIAAGAGFELLLACHLRVASTAASFSLPETWLGLIPGYGGTQRLTREIGVGRAVEWMLTRKSITAEEAFDFGLVNRLVKEPQAFAETVALAEEIGELSTTAIRACLKAVLGGLNLDLKQGLALETELFASLFATEDAREGVRAFLEKRKPVFKGT